MTTDITQLQLKNIMALAGWEIEFADVDLTGHSPTAEIKLRRDDGRWLWARVDSVGRCTIETFHRECALGMVKNQKGRRPLTPLVEDTFLGRSRHPGPRAMMRSMTTYLVDNALRPVALSDMRTAWAALMSGRVLLSGSA